MEIERAVGGLTEHAIQQQAVEVHVQLEPATETLNDGDGTAPSIAYATTAGAAAIETQHRPGMDGEHRAAELVVVREEVAQAMREREHPLAHGDVRQHAVD